MQYFKHLINKFCFKVKSSNLFKFFFGCVFLFFFIPNVNAYVNKDLSNNLVMPSGDAIRFYGWQSETTYVNRTLAYEQDYIADMSDYVKAYYYLTQPTNSNDSNGFSYLINTGLQLSANQNYDLSIVLCSTNSNQWWNSYQIGTGAWDTSRTNYATTNGQTYENLGVYYTDGTTFTMCRKISFNYTSNLRGSVINIRLRSASTVALGQLSFMGYTLSSNGYDYSAELQNLQTSVNNLSGTISNSADAIINNQNTNTNSINNNIDQEFNSLKNQDHTYNNDITNPAPNKSDINSVLTKEDTLRSDIDLSTNALDIQLNTDATTWIWGIVNNIRTINGKITLLFTTILSLAIIKMVLNR